LEYFNPCDPCEDAAVNQWYEEKLLKDIQIVKEWREKSGKQFPPAYKVKITVELEPLSDEESKQILTRKE
jgi:hypothetical protein